MTLEHTMNRRCFLITAAVLGGGMVIGFYLPTPEADAAGILPDPWTSAKVEGSEVNAWLVIASDDTVTIRVAQSEMGEGVFTSMPMLVVRRTALRLEQSPRRVCLGEP